MPSATGKGYRYNTSSDPISDGATATANLATDVDVKAGVLASGIATVTIAATGTAASAAVTFPAGRFTVAPTVVATPINVSSNAPQNFSPAAPAAVTTSGCNVWITRLAGAAATVQVAWVAHQ